MAADSTLEWGRGVAMLVRAEEEVAEAGDSSTEGHHALRVRAAISSSMSSVSISNMIRIPGNGEDGPHIVWQATAGTGGTRRRGGQVEWEPNSAEGTV